LLWYREYLAGIYPEVFDITIDNNGNVIWLAEAENDSTYEYETIITKYLANGDSAWVKHFENRSREPIALTADDEGNVYVLGYARIDPDVDKLLLQKLDSEGRTVWMLDFDDKYFPYEIAIDKDRQIIVCGIYYSNGRKVIKTIKYSQSGVTSANLNSKDVIDKGFTLSQNFPNPFNPTTIIKYSIPASLNRAKEGTLIQLKIYDVLGREVKTLVNEAKQPGEYEVEFNAALLPSGVYFYQLKSGEFIQTKKMLLLK